MIKKDGLFFTDNMTQSDRCLHTPGSFAKQNLLYVQEVGTLQSVQPHRCTREKIDSFLFLAVLEGKGNLDIRGENIEVKAGDCALVDCMEHYEHISDEKEAWRLGWVHFNGRAAREYYELFLKFNENSCVFHTSTVEVWSKLIQDIREKQREKSFLTELQSGEMLLHLLNNVIECVANPAVIERQKSKEQANEIRQMLNEEFMQSSILLMLQESFAKPVSVLNELFLPTYGISIEEYISNRRYNLAKELLRFSIKSVEQIAEETGIGDMVVLQQMFRENESVTAEEYRKKWAGWVRN